MNLFDTHVHTSLCKHATGKIEEYINSAINSGLKGLYFTDHAPTPHRYDEKHRMSIEEFNLYNKMIDKAKKNNEIFIGYGIEADYYNGSLEFLKEWLAKNKFDVVIGSIHYIDDWPFDDPEAAHRWSNVDLYAVWKKYVELLNILIQSELFDVVAHLDLPKKFGYSLPEEDLLTLTDYTLNLIKNTGMVIEINTSGLRKEAKEIYPSINLIKRMYEMKIPICFGSDAHSPSEVGYKFDMAIEEVRRIGYKNYIIFDQRRKYEIPIP